MATVTPVLWIWRPRANGECTIRLRVEANGENKAISIGHSVAAKYWLKGKKRVRSTHPLAAELNRLISDQAYKLERIIFELEDEGTFLTPSLIIERFIKGKPERDPDFFLLCEQRIEELRRLGKVHSSRRYESILQKLKRFLKSNSLPTSKVTPALIRSYKVHLIDDLGNRTSTVSSNIRALRAMYRIFSQSGIIKNDIDPFATVKISEAVVSKSYLSPEDIMNMLGVKVDNKRDHVARLAFGFSFFTGGTRFGDVCRLQSNNIIRDDPKKPMLVYQVSKTNTTKNIPFADPARVCVMRVKGKLPEFYLFPFLEGYSISNPEQERRAIGSQNASVNASLKRVAEAAGIDINVTFHMARHSFADMARKQNYPLYDISKMMGHSSVGSTERYIRSWDHAAVEGIAELFPNRK